LWRDAYRWVLDNADFRRWRDDDQRRLLWIRGDPGKGKTMLLCGIIDELRPKTRLADPNASALLSFFFCQATNAQLNNATAVLRGLLYLLVAQQPSLLSYVQEKYDDAGKPLFNDDDSWFALREILANMLRDPNLQSACLVIDALDECETELQRLLGLISEHSDASSRVKWLVSSRNSVPWTLGPEGSRRRLSLELTENAEQVSRAVDAYIEHSVSELASVQGDEALQEEVRNQMREKADGTFLWAALVFRELKKAKAWHILSVLQEMPPGLVPLYGRMLKQIQQLDRDNPDLCLIVLATATLVYRPLHLVELAAVSGLPEQIARDTRFVDGIVRLCGSFLTVREDYVTLVHQSAKDYLGGQAAEAIFPSGRETVHHGIFAQSVRVMAQTLRRNMYGLRAPGILVNEVEQPDLNPLAAARYSCVYWVDHLQECSGDARDRDLQDGGKVDAFLCERYLYWLEALSLLRRMSEGVFAVAKLEGLLEVRVWSLSRLS
jgi:hypothetical protein